MQVPQGILAAGVAFLAIATAARAEPDFHAHWNGALLDFYFLVVPPAHGLTGSGESLAFTGTGGATGTGNLFQYGTSVFFPQTDLNPYIQGYSTLSNSTSAFGPPPGNASGRLQFQPGELLRLSAGPEGTDIFPFYISGSLVVQTSMYGPGHTAQQGSVQLVGRCIGCEAQTDGRFPDFTWSLDLGSSFSSHADDFSFWDWTTGGFYESWSGWLLPGASYTVWLDHAWVESRAELWAYGKPVPEPATWAMLLAGFGLVGAAMRQRRLAC
ncbi:MAG: PEPxxWA-CTERM sorting domain-containing protein [Sphingomonadaceae bacterium]